MWRMGRTAFAKVNLSLLVLFCIALTTMLLDSSSDSSELHQNARSTELSGQVVEEDMNAPEIEEKHHPAMDLSDEEQEAQNHIPLPMAPSCEEKDTDAMDQDDPCLLQRIEDSGVLIPPPSEPEEMFMDKPHDIVARGGDGQPLVIDRIFNHMKNGFFVEVGASDGEYESKSFHLENYRNWTGLLGEANPGFFAKLRHRNRPRSTLFNGCLSATTRPGSVHFDAANYRGGIISQDEDGSFIRPGDTLTHWKFPDREIISVQCYPLYSILQCLGNPTVDLLSLDVEGAELPILKTIPFDKVNIRVLLVELGKMFSGSKGDIVRLLRENGYRLLGGVHRGGIFARRDDPILRDLTPADVAAFAREVGAAEMAADIRPCLRLDSAC